MSAIRIESVTSRFDPKLLIVAAAVVAAFGYVYYAATQVHQVTEADRQRVLSEIQRMHKSAPAVPNAKPDAKAQSVAKSQPVTTPGIADLSQMREMVAWAKKVVRPRKPAAATGAVRAEPAVANSNLQAKKDSEH